MLASGPLSEVVEIGRDASQVVEIGGRLVSRLLEMSQQELDRFARVLGQVDAEGGCVSGPASTASGSAHASRRTSRLTSSGLIILDDLGFDDVIVIS